jgi:hypothetical protein
MERTKLDLELNQPRKLELLFDAPIKGENRYGPYNLYAFVDLETGEEVTFFAPADVDAELWKYKKGFRFTITKAAKQIGKKVETFYEIIPHATNGANGNGNNKERASKASPAAEHEDETPQTKHDPLVELLRRSCEDALQIQASLNAMLDVNRLAITLFIARSKNGNGHGNGNGYTNGY